MEFIKNIFKWLVSLFGIDAIEKTVEVVEEKTGWDIPEETIVEFANRILPKLLNDPEAKLWHKQEEILNQMVDGNVAVDGDRRTGKTLLLAVYAAYTALTKPNTKVALRSVNLEGGSHILYKIFNILENVKEEFSIEEIKFLKSYIELPNGSTIKVISNLDVISGYHFDIFLGDEITYWEEAAIHKLINLFPTHKSKIQLVSTDWDDKLNKIIDILPNTIEVTRLLFFDKDKEIGERIRNSVKTLGEEGFKKEFGGLFRKIKK